MNAQEIYKKRIEDVAREIYDNYRNETVYFAAKKAATEIITHQWISVDEALPDDNVAVFVRNEYGNHTAAQYSHETECWTLNWGEVAGDDEIYSRITHWMPIHDSLVNPEKV